MLRLKQNKPLTIYDSNYFCKINKLSLPYKNDQNHFTAKPDFFHHKKTRILQNTFHKRTERST